MPLYLKDIPSQEENLLINKKQLKIALEAKTAIATVALAIAI